MSSIPFDVCYDNTAWHFDYTPAVTLSGAAVAGYTFYGTAAVTSRLAGSAHFSPSARYVLL